LSKPEKREDIMKSIKMRVICTFQIFGAFVSPGEVIAVPEGIADQLVLLGRAEKVTTSAGVADVKKPSRK
jgi:hypothetical protein